MIKPIVEIIYHNKSDFKGVIRVYTYDKPEIYKFKTHQKDDLDGYVTNHQFLNPIPYINNIESVNMEIILDTDDIENINHIKIYY